MFVEDDMLFFPEHSEHLQFVLDQKLSDHKPILAEGFLVWNILCLCRVVNNGFRMDETQDSGCLYQVRLRKIAAQINQWVIAASDTDHPIEVICLQEVPVDPAYLTLFLDALDWNTFDRSSIVLTQTGVHKFQNLTIYSKRYSGKVLTEALQVTPDCQAHRYHMVELTDKTSGLTRRVGNVHFKWFSSKKKAYQEATHEVVRELVMKYQCSLMGDFNQSLSWVLEDAELKKHIKAFYYPEYNSAVYLEKSVEGVYYNQIDGLILV